MNGERSYDLLAKELLASCDTTTTTQQRAEASMTATAQLSHFSELVLQECIRETTPRHLKFQKRRKAGLPNLYTLCKVMKTELSICPPLQGCTSSETGFTRLHARLHSQSEGRFGGT